TYQLKKSGDMGLINISTGKEITGPVLNPFRFGYKQGLIDFRRDDKKGLMDSTGRELFYDKYDDFVTGFYYERAWVMKGKKYGFMDRNGQEVIAPQYDQVNG